ncbi:MAG: hypothetical protein AB7F40_11800 [Victivallaceae bacterium]|nr:hypothetical protein [Victivallaceae bacterium]
MKILNIVLSILVLLLAIVSAVFGYLLYEERNTLVEKYSSLTKPMQDTAKALDTGSGTSLAKTLGGDALSYKKDAGSVAQKLTSQARTIANQRDDLAQKLQAVMEAAGGNADFARLTTFDSSKEEAQNVIDQVRKLVNNRNLLAQKMVEIGKKFEVTLSDPKLTSNSREEVLNESNNLVKELGDMLKYKKQQEKAMKQIAADLGKPGLSFTPVRYQADLDTYTTAVQGLLSEKNALESDKKSLDAKLATSTKQLEDKNAQIEKLNAEIARQQSDFDRLQASIEGKAFKYPVKFWQPGSSEARGAVSGKVIDVNAKFGYVVIDLGSDTLVQQPIGEGMSDSPVNPNISADDTLVVAHGYPKKDATYVGRIKIFKVEGPCAYASVIDGSESQIKVGDSVFFGDNAE